jgi:hypothetical protein
VRVPAVQRRVVEGRTGHVASMQHLFEEVSRVN